MSCLLRSVFLKKLYSAAENISRYSAGNQADFSKLPELIDIFQFHEAISKLSIEGIVCNQISTYLLLADLFDSLPICCFATILDYIDSIFHILMDETIYSVGKYNMLRMCNEALESLSRTQQAELCGRIQLLLTRILPADEKSALNLNNDINLSTYNQSLLDENAMEEFVLNDSGEEGEFKNQECDGEMFSDLPKNAYECFDEALRFLSYPPSVLDPSKESHKKFKHVTEEVLQILRQHSKSYAKRKATMSTRGDISKNSSIHKQVSDSMFNSSKFVSTVVVPKNIAMAIREKSFCRLILIQYIMAFQSFERYEHSHERSSAVLEFLEWIRITRGLIYQIIEDFDNSAEKQFCKTVKHLMEQEEVYARWKAEGYTEVQNTKTEPPMDVLSNSFDVDEWELQRRKISNCCFVRKSLHSGLDIMSETKNRKRSIIPSMEDFFQEMLDQADPAAQVEEDYKLVNSPSFQWKALRLMGLKHHNFFSCTIFSNTSMANFLEQYIQVMLLKSDKPRSAINNA